MSDLLLARKLKSKEARLFHAINYTDFVEYSWQESILSRSELAAANHDYTKFFSDDADKELEVWDRTFVNLNDFGRYFWSYEAATPNAYGPITIVLKKNSWDALTDIRITKKTITSEENEQLYATDIDDAFECVDGIYRLRSGYTGIEASSSAIRIPFEYISYILIDPIKVAGRPLREHVINALIDTKCLGKIVTEKQVIERRVYCHAQEERIEQLLAWSRILGGRLINANEPLENTLPQELSEWFHNLEEWKQRILASWLTYIFNARIQLASATGGLIPKNT